MNKNMRILLFLTILSMLLLPALALAEYQVSQYYPLGITPVEKMKPNGEYNIYVLSEGTWQEAGKLTYDMFFRERELDLSSYISTRGEMKLKLIQTGGGAAHIDSVFLGGMSPVEVEGIENGLKKLTKKDFDVADAFRKEIMVTFPKTAKDKTMSLTARVENTVISKTPFQFPSDNICKEMDVNSKFYTYKMNINNNYQGTSTQPFFKEYSQTGSGHPSGYTYGWVSNDDKNLYVRIDFTPDNTMDGDKDYAKVYVKTGDSLKEFKVSVAEPAWGNPAFTYTDKVQYQHKMYEFQIPLREVGINEAKENRELLLAFSAYGTASAVNCPTPNPLELTCNGELANCVGTAGGENINGTSGDDVILGLGGPDNISGNGGDDIICGGDGNDTIRGHGGDDWLSGGPGNDTIYGGSSSTSTGSGKDTLIGNEGDDWLYGGDGNDKLIGNDGDDDLWGYTGNDKLHGNDGDDLLHGHNGNDILHGNDGDDDLYGENNNDRLYGGDGNDYINGGNHNDRCFSGGRDDSDTYVNCETEIPED